jgi:hypothetical protein
VKVRLATSLIDVEVRRASAKQILCTAVAVEDMLTAARDRTYEAERAIYEERVRREGIREAGDPPAMPGLALLRLEPRLLGVVPMADFSAETAGTGSEWTSRWKFFPRDPNDSLEGAEYVEVTTDEGSVRVPVR